MDRDAKSVTDRNMQMSASESISSALTEYIVNLLEVEPSNRLRTTSLLELGADSIALAELAAFIESRFSVTVQLRQLFEELLSIDDILKFIVAARSQPATPSVVGEADLVLPQLSTFVSQLLETHNSEIQPTRSLLELGADSITLAEMVRFIEERFGVPIALRLLFEELLSVQSIANYINERRSPAAPSGKHASTISKSPPSDTSSQTLARAKANGIARQTQRSPAVQTHGALASVRPEPATPSIPMSTDSRTVHMASATAPVPASPMNSAETARAIVARFASRTGRSRAAAERLAISLCNNRRSLSLVRQETAAASYPIQAATSRGAHLIDVEGNDYVDIAMGFGVHLFGHSPDFIRTAIHEQLDKGIHLGPECDLTGDVAQGICEITQSERVLFCNSGTEAVMTAMRIARAASGKSKIAIFRNAYHGHFDGTLVTSTGAKQFDATPMSIGTPVGMVADSIVLPFDSHSALSFIEEHADELAAVLVEPVQNRRPDLHAGAFLKELRRVTRDHGVLLIFDEILVGFRIHVGGAQAWFDVRADLVTYAKIIGGGMPLGVVAGSRDVMACVDGGLSFSADATGRTQKTIYTAGTYCKHPLSMAAARAVVNEFRRNGNGALDRLNQEAERFFLFMNTRLTELDVPIRVASFGSFFRFAEGGNLSFVHQPLTMDLFHLGLLSRGVHVIEGGTCFLSTAHTSSDLEFVADAVVACARELRDGGFWSNERQRKSAKATDRAQELPSRPAHDSSSKSQTTPTGQALAAVTRSTSRAASAIRIGISYFGTFLGDESANAYDLVLQVSRRADDVGLSALWFPERHFHAFGGAFPNPALLAAAAARETKAIGLRAGSVVAALHHPIRIAEEWAVVDQLSGGRAGVAFASGWHAGDFVLSPNNFTDRREVMDEFLRTVRSLWRGESRNFQGPNHTEVEIKTLPRILQPELPVWLASMGGEETFRKAGQIGVGILTNLVSQSIEELERKIKVYKQALDSAPARSPSAGSIVVLMHTLLRDNSEEACAVAREPLKKYLAASIDLVSRIGEHTHAAPIGALSSADREFVFNRGVDRYISSRALIGSPASCEQVLQKLVAAGVTEIACLVDFGADAATVLESVDTLGELQKRCPVQPTLTPRSSDSISAKTLPGMDREQVPDIKPITTTTNQRMLWLANHFDDVGDAYHIRTSLHFRGQLHLEALREAINHVCARHAALRTCFDGVAGESFVTRRTLSVPWSIVDLSSVAEHSRANEVAQWYEEDSKRQIDLESDPLVRVTVLRLSDDDHIVVICTHHIIFDSASEQILFSELCHLYNSRLSGSTKALPAASDYPKLSAEIAEREKSANPHETYWRRILETCETLKLPVDREPKELRSFRGARLRTAFGSAQFGALKRFSAQAAATPFVVVLGAYMAALHQISGQRCVVVGISRDLRAPEMRGNLIGNFTNMLPIVMKYDPNFSFETHLLSLRNTLLDAYEHATLPFGRMVELAKASTWSGPPLVSTCFNWDRRTAPEFIGVQVAVLPDPASHVRFPLSLNAVHTDDALEFEWDYNSDLFDETTVRQLASEFDRRLTALIDTRAGSVEEADHRPQLGTIIERIVLQCAQSRTRPAVRDLTKTISYGELLDLSDRAAATLRTEGVRPDDIVGLVLPPSTAALVAILAIWRLGATFAAIDPEAPDAWVQYALDTGKVRAVIADRPISHSKCLILDNLLAAAPTSTLAHYPAVRQDSLAYVVFTSGSTGKPKAVGIEHAQLVAYVDALNAKLEWDTRGRFAFLSPLHVDLGFTVLFSALAAGGMVLVCPQDLRLDVPGLASFLRDGFDHLKITPSHLSALLEHPDGGQCLPHSVLVCGGEVLSWKAVDAVWAHRPAVQIFNHYGPAETTIGAVAYKVPRDPTKRTSATVPIGTALPGVFVDLRPREDLSTDSEYGEIVISGPTVGRGYLEPTGAESKWVPYEVQKMDGRRWYATGDLAVKLQDGTYVFHGRIDEQVKVRGHRVDLAAIKAIGLRLPGVKSVDAYVHRDQEMICATVVVEESAHSFSEEKFQAYIAVHLPTACVPSRISILKATPVSSSGKSDRIRELIAANAVATAHAPASSPEANVMLTIWREVFGVDVSDLDTNFFDLGGHSIHAIKVLARLKRHFNVHLTIRDLFGSPTVRRLTELVRSRNGGLTDSLTEPEGKWTPNP